MIGRTLHFGPYDGMDIAEVVEHDPAYILELSATQDNTGISSSAINRAHQLLDERNSWDDFSDTGEEALHEFNSRYARGHTTYE